MRLVTGQPITERPPDDAFFIQCPRCLVPTASLKQYRMIRFFLFIGIGAYWQTATSTHCPTCMRREIVVKSLVNLPTANLIWPIAVLPFHLLLFIATFRAGHSRRIREAMSPADDARVSIAA
jgi:hypothetical protein